MTPEDSDDDREPRQMETPPDVDRELLIAWQAGDRRAGDALLVRYYSILRRFFVNKVPRDHVDDLVQTTFVQSLGAFKTFEGRSSVKTFVLTIAYRMLARHFRTKGRKQDRLDPLVDTVEAMSTGIFSKLARQIEQEILLEALRRLPIEDQTVLELYYWEQLTSREAAEILGVLEPTFKSKLRRAKERLRAALVAGRGTADQQAQSRSELTRLAVGLDDLKT